MSDSFSLLNIVVPMAGRGKRFADAGFEKPKPLIEVHSAPMIRWVIENLRPRRNHRFIFIAQGDHIREFQLEPKLKAWAGSTTLVIPVHEITAGAACTVLLARDYLQNNNPLMIANSDQFIDFSIDEYLDVMDRKQLDGLIMTMKANDPKWSYVRLAQDMTVREVAEKKVISNEATVGIYNFARGKDFVRAADQMIKEDRRSNGEFYVAPAYNELIHEGQKVGIASIGEEMNGMYGLGIPSDLEKFLQHPVSENFKRKFLE